MLSRNFASCKTKVLGTLRTFLPRRGEEQIFAYIEVIIDVLLETIFITELLFRSVLLNSQCRVARDAGDQIRCRNSRRSYLARRGDTLIVVDRCSCWIR